MHRLLSHQLRRTLGIEDEAELLALHQTLETLAAEDSLPAPVKRLCTGFTELLDRIENTYGQYDRNLELRNRSLDLSTEELTQANDRLRAEAASQRHILHALRTTANELLLSAGQKPIAADDASLEKLSDLIAELTISRRKAQRELKQQKAALDQHAIVSVTDTSGRILDANDKFCEISGYRREELIGNNHRIVKSGQHPPEFYAAMWEAIAQGQVWHGEVCNRRKNGSLYWVAATIVPILDESGLPERYIGIRTDITEQKQLEAAIQESQHFLQSLTDSMGEGVYALDAEGHCTFLNPEAEQILGWRLAELDGRNFHDTVHYQTPDGTHLPAPDCPILRRIQTGETYRSEDEVFMHRNGRPVPVAVVAVPMREAGQIVGQVAVFQDISERKATERAMAEARDMAEAASRAKSHFLANMSHEIRTPMNAVIGLSHLALETRLDERQRGYLEKIQSSAKNLLGIINDILDFSKIEAGRMSIETGEFSLDEVLEQVAAIVALPAAHKGLELLIAEPADLPERLLGDAMRLGQVLTNLASNAVKFTERGEVVIAVEPLRHEAHSLTLRFSVRDTGIGLNEEQIGRLFESFSQADASTTRKFGGTGLGLAICKRLVELMGGRIAVTSTPGAGSLFHFDLPFQVAPGQSASGPDGTPLRGLRALVVDDNATAREILQAMLAGLGLLADVADSGEACLDALRKQDSQAPYQLVLLDWKLGGTDGLATRAQILADPDIRNKPALLLCTAHGQDAILAGMKPPALTVLQKPLCSSSLRNGLLRALGKPVAGATTPSLRSQHAPVRDVQAIQGILGAKVLLAEDNPINRQVAGEMLERLGLVVRYAENGEAALAAIAHEPFDLVLMDMQMPVLDGYEASRRLRAEGRHPELPIIALTAHAMSGDRERCLDAGMDDYLTKPIDPEALFVMVTKWIRPALRETPPQAVSAANPEPADADLPPTLPGIDMPRALAYLDGDQTLYREILKHFLIEYRELPEQLRSVFASQDSTRAAQITHTLKGVGGTVGAYELAGYAADIDQALRRQETPDATAVASLDACLVSVLAGLEQAFGGATGTETIAPGSALSRPDDLLAQLTPLVAAADLHALDLAGELARRLDGSTEAELARTLARQLNEFDFESAQQTLATLARRLEQDA